MVFLQKHLLVNNLGNWLTTTSFILLIVLISLLLVHCIAVSDHDARAGPKQVYVYVVKINNELNLSIKSLNV